MTSQAHSRVMMSDPMTLEGLATHCYGIVVTYLAGNYKKWSVTVDLEHGQPVSAQRGSLQEAIDAVAAETGMLWGDQQPPLPGDPRVSHLPPASSRRRRARRPA